MQDARRDPCALFYITPATCSAAAHGVGCRAGSDSISGSAILQRLMAANMFKALMMSNLHHRRASLCSASMTILRISLMRVRCPSPLDFNHSTTLGSSRTLTGTFGLRSRNRTI